MPEIKTRFKVVAVAQIDAAVTTINDEVALRDPSATPINRGDFIRNATRQAVRSVQMGEASRVDRDAVRAKDALIRDDFS